ncbi:MAG: bile acid:sodium symporter family protein [Pseudonocardia sp.]
MTTVALPLALAIVMLGLGLTLTVPDFSRVLVHPRAVLVALTCQLVLLPLICFGLVVAVGLAPALAVGMMLLAASPGGITANLFSHLAGGDVALNVTLTAVNSVLAVLTLPIVVNLSLAYFLGSGAIGLQSSKVLQVLVLVLLPVALGMAVRRLAPGFSAGIQGRVKVVSMAVLGLVIIATALVNRAILSESLLAVGPVAVLLCTLSLLIGYGVPRLFRVSRRQSIASAMEIGIHNAALAITVALSPLLLNDPVMAIPAALYGPLAFGPAAIFGYVLSRRRLAAETDGRLAHATAVPD